MGDGAPEDWWPGADSNHRDADVQTLARFDFVFKINGLHEPRLLERFAASAIPITSFRNHYWDGAIL